jgi:hypothetical protein
MTSACSRTSTPAWKRRSSSVAFTASGLSMMIQLPLGAITGSPLIP